MKRFLFVMFVAMYYTYVCDLAGVTIINNPGSFIAINWPAIALGCFVASDWDT